MRIKSVFLTLAIVASISLTAQDCEGLVSLGTKGTEVYLKSSIHIASLGNSIDLSMDGQMFTVDFVKDLGFHNHQGLVEIFYSKYTVVTEYTTDRNILSVHIPLQGSHSREIEIFRDYPISKFVFFKLPVEDMKITLTFPESEMLSKLTTCMYSMVEEMKTEK